MEPTSFRQEHYFVNVYSQHLRFVFEFFQDHNENFLLIIFIDRDFFEQEV